VRRRADDLRAALRHCRSKLATARRRSAASRSTGRPCTSARRRGPSERGCDASTAGSPTPTWWWRS